MKIETKPVLLLDSFTALQSKSLSFSYQMREASDNPIVQKAKQKEKQKVPECPDYIRCLFNFDCSRSTIYSNLHQLTVEKQNKQALNAFDEKYMYSVPIQSLQWDKHAQQGNWSLSILFEV